jgi:hypothetical protein
MAQSIHDETVRTLEAMLDTFKARNTTYGENYLMLGKVMVALFPNGITLQTEEDHIKFHWVSWFVGKFTRFAASGMVHEDSMIDASVYGAMLAAFLKVHAHDDQK